MDNRHKASYLVIAALVISCASLSTDRNYEEDFTATGMKKISSAGRTFHQGWNDPRAAYDERPGMESSFTYDYWLDSTEVTQKQYYEVTGKRPVDTGSPYGVGDDFPVYRVSWFDAVLYCNARSRQDGLDTVYTYSSVRSLSNGSVYNLTGLGYDLSRNGYRLPTEAEWEYAARGGSSVLPYSEAEDRIYANYYAWYGNNSLNVTHPVATRLPNAFGLYDMAGNVFEWTNDWKCRYSGESIRNSFGGFQSGNEYEKVVKGGSYNYPLMYLRPSCRSATYPSMLSAAYDYVGFRCAHGETREGRYIGLDTASRTNPVTVITDWNDAASFMRVSEAKLVFVNVTGSNRTLCWTDFNRTYPELKEYTDDRNVHYPDISPDGRYVAYCSGSEGLSVPSKVSIRRLSVNSPVVQLKTDSAYIPRWWINPASGDTFIVYTNSGVDNGSYVWSATKTYRQRMVGGAPSGEPEEIIAAGGYHDGISVDGRYAVTGYTQLHRCDLTTGRDTQLFMSPENGKSLTGSMYEQACNVSISPGGGDSARCMFLDFGYPDSSMVVGRSYGVHEILFVSDMEGNITETMVCPSGELSWDGVEWTNQTGFGVGCGRNAVNQAHAVYAIDLNEKKVKKLVEGTELQQPYLYLSTFPFSLPSDSLGRYNEPPVNFYQATLAEKLLLLWRVFDSVEIVVLGSSHASLGVDPRHIAGLRAVNIASIGGDFLGLKIIFLNYVLNHCPRIKLLCSSLDMGCNLDIPEGNVNWKQGVGRSNGYRYDSCHFFWPGGLSRAMIDGLLSIPVGIDTCLMGFDDMPSSGWGDSVPPVHPVADWTTVDPVYQANLAAITMLADTLRSRKIHWIMINFPVSPHYRGTEHYSIWGPSWQTAHDILQQIRGLETANQYFHLYDANIDGNHDYSDSEAWDCDHLCGAGARKLSMRLTSIIDSVLSK